MKEPEGMTPRERMKNAMDFKEVDVIPWYEEFFIETLVKFFSEGLPAHKMIVIDWTLGFDPFFSNILINWPKFKCFDPYSYFGCINLGGMVVPVDIGPLPRFKQRKIKEDRVYEEYIMESGVRSRRFKKGIRETRLYSMPQFYEFPVNDKKSWEQYKERLNPEDARRYPKDWEKESYLQMFANYQDGPTSLTITGFYGFGAELMGIPNFTLAFYKDPELIRDMLSYWEYFTIESVREAVETLKDRIDFIFWWEDLAERHGPNISPKLYRDCFLKNYKRIIEFFKKYKIHRHIMDSDGNTEPILDLIIEAGITGHLPLEVNSGMDVRTLRKHYGNKLFLAGNLDKREIMKGGEAMRKEIDSKLPLMKETGGYIAGLDHDVHIEFTFKKFKEYTEYLKEKLVIQ